MLERGGRLVRLQWHRRVRVGQGQQVRVRELHRRRMCRLRCGSSSSNEGDDGLMRWICGHGH